MTGAAADAGLRLLLTGGGTGGHLFPAIATAEEARTAQPDAAVLFIGTRRRLDADALTRSGFAVKTIHSYGLKGKRALELVKALAVLPLSLLEAGYQVLRFRPDVVLGVGGYVTGPVVAVSWLLGKPTVIHEQNSVPGLANRQLGRFVDRVCISLPQSERFFPPGKTVLTGNPVRRAIVELHRAKRPAAAKKTLLVLGGSQGARSINHLMVEAASLHPGEFARLQIIHQTGADDEAMVADAYERLGLEHRVAAFFTDMATMYAEADLIVSRAGATTLAEIGVVGTPAILIPYPFAADDHQQKNAAWYVDSGAAVCLNENGLSAAALAAELLAIIGDDDRRSAMAAAMGRLGIADAAARIVEICLALRKR